MSSISTHIEELCRRRESVSVEFKSGKGGFPGSFWETFSAFANTDGGVIVIGVREKNGHFTPDGLSRDQLEAYRKQFWNDAHNKSKVSSSLLLDGDLEVLECTENGTGIMVFHIPRAPYMLRPVYLTQNPFGNTYKRNHEGDYRCSDYQVRRMFADADHAMHPADARILKGFTIDDIDRQTLAQYRQRFQLRQEEHVWNSLPDLEFLKRLGAYRIDRENSAEGFTVAGMLMFGKTESITDPSCCPWFFLDYREKLSLEPTERWTNRVFPDGNWEANLFQFFYRVYPLMIQALSVPFRLDGATRVDETAAHKAVREALVNTLVHADYMQRGNIVIERTIKELRFANPGTMLISVSEFYEGGRSECRNPNLQKMFMLLGGGERAGSGAETIVRAWEEQSWGTPRLEEDSSSDSVVLVFQLNSKRLPQASGVTTPQENGATPQENGGAPQENGVTPQENGVTPQENGVTPQENGAPPQENGATPQENGATPQENGAPPQENGVTPQENGVTTPQENGATPQENGATPQENGVTPQENVILLQDRKCNREEMIRAILEYCKTPRSLSEIARLLGLRDKRSLRELYIRPLLGQSLELTHPEHLRHKYQKYHTISSQL